ncbi:MAG: GerW family sporulation protein [Ruminococcus sp.]|nr:GerW family sporulation protein [Ruminococcus sp.]
MQESKENTKINGLMGVTLENLREMVDVQTIIGDPIIVSKDITIIPISKVSYGFASGGSDLPSKNNPKDLFGGGTGAGVSIQPVGFLVVQDGNVRLLQMNDAEDTAGNLIKTIPEVVNQIGNMVKSKKEN